MTIHELNTKALTDPAYVAFDDGTDTYKVEFNDVLEEKTAEAVAAADLTQNEVAFTSGDAASPTAWTNVSVITSGSTLATLFNRISTMVKNVRYIWNLIGTTTMGTTATTITGAIKEHETDISTLNGKIKLTYLNSSYSTRNAVLSAIDSLASDSNYAIDIKIPNSNAVLLGLQDTSYYLRVIRFSAAQTLIIAFPVNPTRIFMIRKNNSVWDSSWRTVALTVFES